MELTWGKGTSDYILEDMVFSHSCQPNQSLVYYSEVEWLWKPKHSFFLFLQGKFEMSMNFTNTFYNREAEMSDLNALNVNNVFFVV